MGCCLTTSNKEIQHLPEEKELAKQRSAGTWGVYVPSDEESSEHTLSNNGRTENKSKQHNKRKRKLSISKLLKKPNKHESIEMYEIKDREQDEQEKKKLLEIEMERIEKEKERKEREEEERIEKEKRLKRANKRKNAMKELLSTEQTYVNLLNKCIDTFVDPLLLKPELLKPEQNRILFSDIKVIHGINKAFLDDLNSKFSAYDNNNNDMDIMDMTIGEEIKKFTPYFRCYQNYLNNYESASVLLQKLTKFEKNKWTQFNEWYNSQRTTYCNNKTLDFYLILPIQRLPRYKLCLNEIIKHTECDHADLNDLNFSLQMISDTVSLCNDRMREYQSRSIVREIEMQFISFSNCNIKLVTPSRRFIKQGTLYRITRRGDEHKLKFYLFNDLLCYASESISVSLRKNSTRKRDRSASMMEMMEDENAINSNLRLQMRMPIDDIFNVKDVCDDIPMKKYNGKAFEIHSSVKSIIVYAETMKDKAEWLLALTHCFEKMQSGSKYHGKTRYELAAAVWIPDDWSDICMVDDCRKKFNSITTRRHHCRWCGKLICGSCGKYKLSHKIHLNNMVKPVCKECYNRHHHRFRANTGASLYKDDEDNDDENEQDMNENKLLNVDENNVINNEKKQFLTVTH
eukprot:378566_1